MLRGRVWRWGAGKLLGMKCVGIVVLLYTLVCGGEGRACAGGPSERAAEVSSAKVGVVTRDFSPAAARNWRGMETHALHTLIWYPAADTAVETEQEIGPPGAPVFREGKAMPHAPFAPAMEGLPVILLSHGAGGSAEQMAWLGTALARAGFIAAAVEHPGDNSMTGVTAEGSTLWWERATDLSEVLDGLLADAELAPHIDRDRVGAAGFSIGGFAVLELGGARSDISRYYDLCQRTPEASACSLADVRSLGAPGHTLSAVRETSGESLARSGESFRDPRVRAVIAIAPAFGSTFTVESLRAMRVPVDLLVGGGDTVTPTAENAEYIREHVHGAKLTSIPGAGHATFLDLCTPAGRQSVPTYCSDGPDVNRAAVHEQVDGMAEEFFARALRLR